MLPEQKPDEEFINWRREILSQRLRHFRSVFLDVVRFEIPKLGISMHIYARNIICIDSINGSAQVFGKEDWTRSPMVQVRHRAL